MRKKIELLKDHANFAADGIDCLLLVVEINAVNDDSPLLISLQVIDAADQRGFARSRWAAQNDFLACADHQINVGQGFEVAVPFLYAFHEKHGRRGAIALLLYVVHSPDA